MENFEKMEILEKLGSEGIQLPEFHYEGLDSSKPLKLESIASNIYEKEVIQCKGLFEEWKSICSENAPEELFIKAYREYIFNAPNFKENNTVAYNFIKDRIFYGQEFMKNAGETGDDSQVIEKINNSEETRDNPQFSYSTTMGWTKPSDCSSWARHGGWITCY